jgi:hypothetical protein
LASHLLLGRRAVIGALFALIASSMGEMAAHEEARLTNPGRPH